MKDEVERSLQPFHFYFLKSRTLNNGSFYGIKLLIKLYEDCADFCGDKLLSKKQINAALTAFRRLSKFTKKW